MRTQDYWIVYGDNGTEYGAIAAPTEATAVQKLSAMNADAERAPYLGVSLRAKPLTDEQARLRGLKWSD